MTAADRLLRYAKATECELVEAAGTDTGLYCSTHDIDTGCYAERAMALADGELAEVRDGEAWYQLTAERDQMRAALAIADQRREDLRVELWKHVDVQVRRVERAERDRDKAAAALRRVDLLHVWTNEDRKRFVFVDDLYAALAGES